MTEDWSQHHQGQSWSVSSPGPRSVLSWLLPTTLAVSTQYVISLKKEQVTQGGEQTILGLALFVVTFIVVKQGLKPTQGFVNMERTLEGTMSTTAWLLTYLTTTWSTKETLLPVSFLWARQVPAHFFARWGRQQQASDLCNYFNYYHIHTCVKNKIPKNKIMYAFALWLVIVKVYIIFWPHWQKYFLPTIYLNFK